MQWLERPLIMLGHGIRLAGAAALAPRLLELGLPVAASWPAKDLVDCFHHNFLGVTGVYGNRAANITFAAADQIVAIGCRLSPWTAGEQGLDHKPQVVMPEGDLFTFIQSLEPASRMAWLRECHDQNAAYPWLEAAHGDTSYINSYRFTQALEPHLAADQIIVTEIGTPSICAHQVLHTKPPQRLLTSGGLGEMGCGLAAAIGASFARGKGSVLCLMADGGLMMNLQELQTIIHHKLPIKIIVFENEGYLMIKHTQNIAGYASTATKPANGVSLPNYLTLGAVLGFEVGQITTWKDFENLIPLLMKSQAPAIIVYRMHPLQPLVPRLQPIDGMRPTFDRMSPLL